MATGVTDAVPKEGPVGCGLTGALVVLGCFVGLRVCLDSVFTGLTVVFLGIVDFDGLGFGIAGLGAVTLTVFGLGFGGADFGEETLGFA